MKQRHSWIGFLSVRDKRKGGKCGCTRESQVVWWNTRNVCAAPNRSTRRHQVFIRWEIACHKLLVSRPSPATRQIDFPPMFGFSTLQSARSPRSKRYPRASAVCNCNWNRRTFGWNALREKFPEVPATVREV